MSYHGVRLAITTQFSITLKVKMINFLSRIRKIQVKLVRRQHLAAFSDSKNSVSLKTVAFFQVEPQ